LSHQWAIASRKERNGEMGNGDTRALEDEPMSRDPYRAERQLLVDAVTRSKGSLPPQERQSIVDRAAGRRATQAIPDGLARFVDQVARDATVIDDDDVTLLIAAGHDEEAVFEAIVAASLGASLARLERVDLLLDSDS
jgi:hypothetical protein